MAAAKTLRCATCARQVHPGVARPARLNYTADFNDEVAIDCFELKDSTGKSWSFCSIVDIGTTFHIAGLLADHRSETMGESFMQLWCCWAGPPNKVRIDMERGFGAHFQTLMDKFGLPCTPRCGTGSLAAWTRRASRWLVEGASQAYHRAHAGGRTRRHDDLGGGDFRCEKLATATLRLQPRAMGMGSRCTYSRGLDRRFWRHRFARRRSARQAVFSTSVASHGGPPSIHGNAKRQRFA